MSNLYKQLPAADTAVIPPRTRVAPSVFGGVTR
jgi:hypothetical protein